MRFLLASAGVVTALFVAMLLAQHWGRRLGERHRQVGGKAEKDAFSSTEGSVLALLGLFLAFTFSGAGGRFDERRHLVIEEANAIGTAWLRIDVLPADHQPEIRELFRDYLDARLATYRLLGEGGAYEAAWANSVELQGRIWKASVAAANAGGQSHAYVVLLPALNNMFDIASERAAVTRIHSPPAVYLMIAFLALVSAVFVGYHLAGSATRSPVHTLAFAAVLSIVIYVIVDLEFPRLGLIRVDDMDALLVELRELMR